MLIQLLVIFKPQSPFKYTINKVFMEESLNIYKKNKNKHIGKVFVIRVFCWVFIGQWSPTLLVLKIDIGSKNVPS